MDGYGGPPRSEQEGSLDGSRKGFRGTAENAKTQVCMRWLNGDCRFGDRCNFAHGEAELRALPTRQAGRGGRGGRGAVTSGRFPAQGGRRGYPERFQMEGQDMNAQAGMRPSFPGAIPPNMSPNVWAQSGYPLAGANGWVMYRVPDTGEAYYHHAQMGLTQWEQPADFIQR